MNVILEFNGLPAVGKSTIAKELLNSLNDSGIKCYSKYRRHSRYIKLEKLCSIGCWKVYLVTIKPGEFTIERHIALPRYLADGDYTLDFILNDSGVQSYILAWGCQNLHIEGFHDQCAHNLRLDKEGFIELESAY
jgi:hypothetical protein